MYSGTPPKGEMLNKSQERDFCPIRTFMLELAIAKSLFVGRALAKPSLAVKLFVLWCSLFVFLQHASLIGIY